MDGSKRILLVEDDAQDVTLMLEALAKHDWAEDVGIVRDGAQALDYLFRRGAYARHPAGYPAVVLLDIKMPKVNGIEVLRRIKSDPELRVVPVVMLSSSREEQDVRTSYELGANAYVVKPVGFHALVEAIGVMGLFWAGVNEPPPGALVKRAGELPPRRLQGT